MFPCHARDRFRPTITLSAVDSCQAAVTTIIGLDQQMHVITCVPDSEDAVSRGRILPLSTAH